MAPRHVHPGDPITAGWANAVSSELRRAARITAAYPLQITAGAFGINIALAGDSGFDLVELIDTLQANDINKTATPFSFNSTETDPWIESLDGSADPIALTHVAEPQQSLYLAGERHLTFWHPAAGQRIPIPGVQWHFGKLRRNACRRWLGHGRSVASRSKQRRSRGFDVQCYCLRLALSSGDSLASGTAVMTCSICNRNAGTSLPRVVRRERIQQIQPGLLLRRVRMRGRRSATISSHARRRLCGRHNRSRFSSRGRAVFVRLLERRLRDRQPRPGLHVRFQLRRGFLHG